MARTFGDVMRDIGRALGLGAPERSTNNVNRGPMESSPRPQARPAQASIIGRADRDGPDRSDRQAAAPAAPPAAVAQPVQPGAAAPTDGTLTPPAAPAPVNPSDMASTGAAEDAALASAQQGRASTIATGAQGLLAEEEPAGLLRRRRSLLGGGLIA